MGDMANYYRDQWVENGMQNKIQKKKSAELGALLKHPISALRQVVSWETKEGQQILLKDIPDDHLRNIIRFLRNQTAGEKGERLRTLNNWLDVTKREQDYRRTHVKTIPEELKEESGALTWEELADMYDQHHGGSRPARTLPMETVYDWACRMTTLFVINGPEGTIHIINKS